MTMPSYLTPCRACYTPLLIGELPPGPMPDDMTIDGMLVCCTHCANIQLKNRDGKLRDLTADERQRIQPSAPSDIRDSRAEQLKSLHDRIARELTERMSNFVVDDEW